MKNIILSISNIDFNSINNKLDLVTSSVLSNENMSNELRDNLIQLNNYVKSIGKQGNINFQNINTLKESLTMIRNNFNNEIRKLESIINTYNLNNTNLINTYNNIQSNINNLITNQNNIGNYLNSFKSYVDNDLWEYIKNLIIQALEMYNNRENNKLTKEQIISRINSQLLFNIKAIIENNNNEINYLNTRINNLNNSNIVIQEVKDDVESTSNNINLGSDLNNLQKKYEDIEKKVKELDTSNQGFSNSITNLNTTVTNMDKRITNLSNGQNDINEDFKNKISLLENRIKELEEKANEIKESNNKSIRIKKESYSFEKLKNSLNLNYDSLTVNSIINYIENSWEKLPIVIDLNNISSIIEYIYDFLYKLYELHSEYTLHKWEGKFQLELASILNGLYEFNKIIEGKNIENKKDQVFEKLYEFTKAIDNLLNKLKKSIRKSTTLFTE